MAMSAISFVNNFKKIEYRLLYILDERVFSGKILPRNTRVWIFVENEREYLIVFAAGKKRLLLTLSFASNYVIFFGK